MQHAGFTWSLRPEGDQWRWTALRKQDQSVWSQGLCRTRAEAAATLARIISFGVLADRPDAAA